MLLKFGSNQTFAPIFAVGEDGIAAEALGGLMTDPGLSPTGELQTSQRAATVTTTTAVLTTALNPTITLLSYCLRAVHR